MVLLRARLVAADFLAGFFFTDFFFAAAIVVQTIPALLAKPKIVGSPI
jgi:hypothetical protein